MDRAAVPVSGLFVFGTLRHDPLREAVLGRAVAGRPVRLEGWQARRAAGGDWPVLVEAPGAAAEGLLLEGLSARERARADFFELGFGYERRPVRVAAGESAVSAQAYFAADPSPADATIWDFAAWQARSGALWCAAAEEAMDGFGSASPEALARRWSMILLRAASRLRAARPAPASLRSAYSAADDVEIRAERRPYTDFFALREQDLRFRKFDGGFSDPVTRTGFLGGDAATVLPWDPAADTVLLVEQFRAGPLMRGDPLPWTLEPIAGRIDPGESPEACVRREAVEEAGLSLGALHHVAAYYPSTGAVSEFVYSFVAETDLDGRGGEVGGVAHEHEDIRAHVIQFERLMQLVASGEAANAPLILSALWLQRHRDGR
jgi:nudix-type nucleoside diphosphatase (YffH/AdpP family)